MPTEDRGELAMTVYTAEPATPSEDALKLLASWAAMTASPTAPHTTTLTNDRP